MASEGGGRPLLPQTAQMQSFSFAPPAVAPRENQRNYVFVDEHNRHKRLKVMRACEGCRRRKIKCDAATTNSWPCAACIRLKLNCVPPTVTYEKDGFSTTNQPYDLESSQDYHSASAGLVTVEEYQRQQALQQPIRQQSGDSSHLLSTSAPVPYGEPMRMYPTPQTQYVESGPPDVSSYGSMQPPPVITTDLGYKPQPMYATQTPTQSLATPDSESAWRNDNASSLIEALGDLKIDHTAIASYIVNQKKNLTETPAVEEYEVNLPTASGPDNSLRIPVEMMPSDTQALRYFDYFFENIHPYVPVINRAQFYHQWHNGRTTISPLILEAIFACASLMLGERELGNQWLALASKHEESFKDVPRLSTIQASLLILKARESIPKRGYFYRSWVSVANAVSMAKELDMEQHYEIHQMGKQCSGIDGLECATKTRVWQLLFMLEIIVGGPQGRDPHKFGTNASQVDFSIPHGTTNPDDPEGVLSRQFPCFLRIVKEVTTTTKLSFQLRKIRKDWVNAPEFLNQNQAYPNWHRDLPQDFQIHYPADGSPPWIPSHFVANVHCYYHLGTIMHHRALLHQYSDFHDGPWKQYMLRCYDSAKSMCRLQEAVIQSFGMTGLFFMQRGVSFHIYAVLTCTMLHLVAITSPDPDLNGDAREYFVRHMRLLEQVSPLWPVPEMQEQIKALRLAFSADIDKPFELKQSFPLGSPGPQNQPSPMDSYRPRDLGHNAAIEQPGQVTYHAHPITPPMSTHDQDLKTDSPVAQSLAMMAAAPRPQPTVTTPMVPQENVQWNPNRIFEQWNTAFGTPPQSTTSSQSSPPLRPPQPGASSYEVRTPQDSHPPTFPQIASVSPQSHPPPNMQAQLPLPVSYAAPASNYVTPSMWQDVVASSYGDGLKRRYDWGGQGMLDQGGVIKRQR